MATRYRCIVCGEAAMCEARINGDQCKRLAEWHWYGDCDGIYGHLCADHENLTSAA